MRLSLWLALATFALSLGCGGAADQQTADRQAPDRNETSREEGALASSDEAQAATDAPTDSASAEPQVSEPRISSPRVAQPPIPQPPTANPPLLDGPSLAPATTARSPRARSRSAAESAAMAPLRSEASSPRDSDSAAASLPQDPGDPSPDFVPENSASENSASAVVRNESDFAVMQVFYATNRDPIGSTSDIASWIAWAVALVAAVVTVGLFFEAKPARNRRAAWIALAFTVVALGYAAMQGPGRRQPHGFGAERGPLQYGVSEVSIPHTHTPGELESPSILRLEFAPDPKRHLVIQTIQPTSSDTFFADVRDAATDEQNLLVFVHGYNVHFDEALLRTAQLSFDLKFQGAPILFSWPSHGGLLKYPMDLSNADWSTAHFKQFLLDLRERTQAKSINILAHSMGNRVLTQALSELALEHNSEARFLDEVVLAAPDVDTDRFLDLAPRLCETAHRVTLYASSDDQALVASKRFNGAARAGDSGERLVVISGVDTIDASDIDTSLLGHSYYGDSYVIIQDLQSILHLAHAPSSRSWLAPRDRSGLPYWVFEKAEAVLGDAAGAEALR